MSNAEAAKPAAGKGMAGMVVSDSNISFVDGTNGVLEYRGYDIRVLADNSTYEEAAYLLWNGRLPTANELAEMKRQVARLPLLAPRGGRRLAQSAQKRRSDGGHAHVRIDARTL